MGTVCRSVLLIEDDPNIRETAKSVLESDGYNVVTAEHGKDALALLPTLERPAVCLVDLNMPVLDGWQFIEAISKDHQYDDVPVVVVSAVAEKHELPARVSAKISKPFQIDDLVAVVRRLCGEPPS